MPDARHLPSTPRREGDARAARVVAALAARQHGVVATRQLRERGLGSATISRWTADRRLIRLFRGVYAVGHRRLTADGHRMAAVLAAGPGAVLSHRSGAALWGLLPAIGALHHVTVDGAGGRGRRAGIRVHRCRLHPDDRTTRAGIPVTTPARTLLDLAESEPRRRLARAVEEAERAGVLDLDALHEVMARHPGRRGLRPLAAELRLHAPEPLFTRSGLERAALRLIREHGLPRPDANVSLHGFEVDLLWADQGVVVELDSPAFHGSTAAFHRDRARDAQLQVLGYAVLRFTDRQIADEGPAVAALIAAALGRASPFLHPSEGT